MLKIDETQRVRVSGLENKGEYTSVKVSSSRFNKQSNEYVYTDWFATFRKTAHDRAGELKEGSIIVLKSATIAREPYMKDGEKTWPKNANITVWDWDFYEAKEKDSSKKGLDTPPVVEDTDEFPF